MKFITLTSDWGTKDHYLSMVKAKLINAMPNAKIVDISHNINHFDYQQAAFVIRNSYHSFPEGSIHIIAVNSEVSAKKPHTLLYADGHYFIGADTGIFSLICDKEPTTIIHLNIVQDGNYSTFACLDIFVKAAIHIAQGGKIENLGQKVSSIRQMLTHTLEIHENKIIGSIIYIDGYENCITNISKTVFEKTLKTNKFTIYLKGMSYHITKINKSYNEVDIAEKVALFSSSGYLEIAINQGNASGLLGLEVGDTVFIKFD